MEKAQADMTDLLLTIPNIANADVPEGKDANDNVVVKKVAKSQLSRVKALCHWDWRSITSLILELGVKITGQVFLFYIGKMAFPTCL